MIEIRIHGRGGQGGVTLAKIIAATRFLGGQSVQAFGLYAAERSGAPIQAFCRFGDEPITNRNLVYEPDHVIVLDPTLVGPAVAEGLKPGGWILVNSPEPPETFAEAFPAWRLATVDATAIARAHGLGTRSVPIVNTALAGAAGGILEVDLAAVHRALEHLGFGGPNLEAATEARESLRRLDAPHDANAPRPERPAPSRIPVPGFVGGDRGGDPPTARTGSWATEQPLRRQSVPPCNHGCPAGNDVQGFLHALAREETDLALEILLRTTPFPAVCGRVCPAPCMEMCNRIGLDGAVNVRELERWAGDHGVSHPSPNGKRPERIAVVGSGPAGLTAAYHLARFGYRVIVHESGSELGGLLRAGIPGYRLPAEVLDREIERILAVGVDFETGRRIDRAALLELTRDHDAVLVATGLQELRGLALGIGDSPFVLQGIDFLDRSRRGTIRLDGERVVVLGGGNTAVDAARSALRLGAGSVSVVYRRTRAEMPAIAEEIEGAIEEGIELDFLLAPVSLRDAGVDSAGRRRCLLTCRRVELGPPDESGRRAPVEIAGTEFDLPCNRVMLALGQSPDLTVFPEGAEVRESRELLGLLETPVFAIGDLATHDGTVAGAIGSGRRAAFHVHETLSGELIADRERRERDGHARSISPVDVWRDEVVRAESMKLHIFERQRPAAGAARMPWERTWNFDEIHQGLADPGEAKRCLSCGVCDLCERCVTYCPDGVLKRVGDELVFDYAFCKGCGVCAAECPRDVVFMSRL